MSQVVMVLFCAVGLLGLYLAGNVGLYAALALVVLVAFVIGLATRVLRWVVRVTRSRTQRL